MAGRPGLAVTDHLRPDHEADAVRSDQHVAGKPAAIPGRDRHLRCVLGVASHRCTGDQIGLAGVPTRAQQWLVEVTAVNHHVRQPKPKCRELAACWIGREAVGGRTDFAGVGAPVQCLPCGAVGDLSMYIEPVPFQSIISSRGK